MAACAIEDAVLTTLVHYQTAPTMIPTQSSSFENINQLCSCNFQATSIQVDSTSLLRNHESTKKRTFHRSITYDCTNTFTIPVTDNSCLMQAISKKHNNEIPTNHIQSAAFLLTDSTINRRPIPVLRTCLSHPATSSNSWILNDDNGVSPIEFSSTSALTSPPLKRIRPQGLVLAPKTSSVPEIPKINPISPTYINLLDSYELADKLKADLQCIIFDCGSPFRYGESRIYNSKLLRVADKISRKRLKTNSYQHLPIDVQQLNECDLIILYDDHANNHQQLSAGLKCAYEEIQRCLMATTAHSKIFILKNSFNDFLSCYPDLCESCHSQSSSSANNSSSPSTPVLSKADLQNYPMTHIIDGLFIGSESNAKNLEELSSNEIRYIVNVTSHLPSYHMDRFQYYNIPVQDTQTQNLLDHFEQAYKFIHTAIENNEKVLVHCVAGISRSPAIVISFLMRYAHMNMNDAYEFVKKKRSIVSPNLNFMGQLLQYEKKLREKK